MSSSASNSAHGAAGAARRRAAVAGDRGGRSSCRFTCIYRCDRFRAWDGTGCPHAVVRFVAGSVTCRVSCICRCDRRRPPELRDAPPEIRDRVDPGKDLDQLDEIDPPAASAPGEYSDNILLLPKVNPVWGYMWVTCGLHGLLKFLWCDSASGLGALSRWSAAD